MAEYYIDTGGLITNPGTVNRPISSLTGLFNVVLNDGDRFRFAGNQSHQITGTFQILGTGSTHPIVFESYGNGKALIYSTGTANDMFVINKSSNIQFNDISISCNTGIAFVSATGNATGIYFNNVLFNSGGYFFRQAASVSQTNIVLNDCKINHAFVNGLFLNTGDITINDVEFRYCGMSMTGTTGASFLINPESGSAIFMTGRAHLKVNDSSFTDCKNGIYAFGTSLASSLTGKRNWYGFNNDSRITGTYRHYGLRITGAVNHYNEASIFFITGSREVYAYAAQNSTDAALITSGFDCRNTSTSTVCVFNDNASFVYFNNIVVLDNDNPLATWFFNAPLFGGYNRYELANSGDSAVFKFQNFPDLTFATWLLVEDDSNPPLFIGLGTNHGLLPGWSTDPENSQGISTLSDNTGSGFTITGLYDFNMTPQRTSTSNVGPHFSPELIITKRPGGYGRRGYTPN